MLHCQGVHVTHYMSVSESWQADSWRYELTLTHFIIFASSFAVLNHAGLPLTDTYRPGIAGR